MVEKIRSVLRECRDYLECFIIPAMAMMMPWWLVVRVFHLLAYVPWLYRHCLICLEGARHLKLSNIDGMTEAQWVHACKVGQMIEYADIYLILANRKSYWKKYIDTDIDEKIQDKQVIFTPHYGAGMWMYWYLRQKNSQAVMFVNAPRGKSLSAHHCLARLRLWILRRLGAKIVSPDNLLALREVLRSGATIIVGPDIPVEAGVDFYTPETSLGRLNLTSRFFDLAEKRKLPVLHIIFAIDVQNGHRKFTVKAQCKQTAISYAQTFADLAATAIKKQPYLWRMLIVAPEVMLPLNNWDE